MALTKYRLGELIKQRREKYDGLEELPARGVAREGFISPKQDGADLSLYNVYYLNDFVFNPARMELNSIALNTFWDKAICSSLYEIFYVERTDLLLPEYLNLFVKRDEFARKCWFEAVGSARNYFRVSDLSEFEIDLPDLPTQQKYVDIYKAMVANQQCYERGLDDLKLVCDGYIEDLRRKIPGKKIGKYIQQKNERNSDKALTCVMGLSTKKEFREAQSRVNREELGNYKIVNHNDIAFVPTTDTWKVLAFAVNKFNKPIVVSPIYEVFSVEQSVLLSPYLAIWLSRREFDRYARYNSWGSARENFSFEEMCNVEIPIPDINVQKSIVDIYNVYTERKRINDQLKLQIKNICPILIRGSLEEIR
ncbi:MAG: restriction endonuclease subunit S [Opitutales bacterium]|nr:restriction endonuclease subunit S [Opitutales bacterium]